MPRHKQIWQIFSYYLVFYVPVSAISMTTSELEMYDRKGHYQAELAQKVEDCKTLLSRWLEKHQPIEKPAAIFDIDETILSNMALIRKSGYRFTKNDFNQQVESSEPQRIESTYTLLKALHEKAITVFFVTGRTESMCEVTAAQLAAAGIKPEVYHSITCTPSNDHAVWKFKQAMRDKLAQQGYTIVLNISDQDKDLIDTKTGVICKLPNPFYETA